MHQNEELYRTLTEKSFAGVYVVQDGRFKFINTNAASYADYTQSEMIGMRSDAVIHPEDREKARENARQRIRGACTTPYEFRIVTKQGRVRWIMETVTPIDYEGQAAILGNAMDITERKRTEELLRKSEERYRTIIENIEDGYFEVDLAGDLRLFNESFRKILGYSAGELTGMNYRRYAANAETADAVFKTYNKIYKTGEALQRYEWDVARKDGVRRIIEVSASLSRNADGRPTGFRGIVRDITDRKLADDDLRESKQQLADIIEFLPDATFVIDGEGKVIAWNRSMEEMTGIKAEDMLGKGNREYALPFYGKRRPLLIDFVMNPRPGMEVKYRYVEKRNKVITGETYIPLLRGKEAYLYGAAAALRDSRGNNVGAIESIRDVTDRKKAEEALKESENLFKLLFEKSGDANLLISGDVFIDCNESTLKMLGCTSKEQVLMLRPSDLSPEKQPDGQASREKERAFIAKAFVEGSARFEWVHRRIDNGGDVPVEITLTSIPQRGKWILHVGWRDISERKKAEEAMKTAERKYRGLFENAVVGIFQTTQEGCIISANIAFARILGYDSSEEVMGAKQGITELLNVHPKRRSEFLDQIEKKNSSGEFEFQIFRKDSGIVWVSVHMRSIHAADGNVLYYEGILQDITERKVLESRLLQSQKMEAIGTLAGGIAHDFNNILSAILGYTEMALADIEDSRVRNYLMNVFKAGERARDLVKQILTFSRQNEERRHPLRMGPIVKETLKLLRASLPSTIKIQESIQSDPDTVLAEPTRMHQLVMNLCTNAAYAMRDRKGTLNIVLSPVAVGSGDIDDLPPGSYLRLSVGDTGCGIDPLILNRIFDPFFSTKKPGEGTGMGLAVVHGIVKSCGGEVAVQSEAGKGSNFDVYLPLIEFPKIDERARAAKPIYRGEERILFVDDDPILVQLGKEALGGWGYDVVGRADSLEALELFRAKSGGFDIVITDMTMPNMTGVELTREILRIRPDIPIILCTGFSEAVAPETATSIGIRAFVMKPVIMQQLAEIIRRELERKQQGI